MAVLSEAQQKDAKDAFKFFDRKDEETIKIGDLSAALLKLGHNVKADWMEKMNDYFDIEGTGYVQFEEFLDLLKRKIQSDEDEKELRDCFRVLDKKKTGEVDTNEIRWILQNLGCDMTEDDIDEMIADVDTDGSGFVDFEEFSKLMLAD